MPKINVDVPSQFSPQETFEKVKSLFGDNSDLKKIDSSMTCDFDHSQLCAKAKGQQFTASMQVQPSNSGSSVSVDVDIPFLLTPLKGQIKSKIESKLQKILA